MVALGPDDLTYSRRNRAPSVVSSVEMPHVHLPAQHTEEDLVLAGALASLLESDELYVAWSLEAGRAEPVIPAALLPSEPECPPRRRGLFARLFRRSSRR